MHGVNTFFFVFNFNLSKYRFNCCNNSPCTRIADINQSTNFSFSIRETIFYPRFPFYFFRIWLPVCGVWPTQSHIYIAGKRKKSTARQKKSFLTAKRKQKKKRTKSENKRNASSKQIQMKAKKKKTNTSTWCFTWLRPLIIYRQDLWNSKRRRQYRISLSRETFCVIYERIQYNACTP